MHALDKLRPLALLFLRLVLGVIFIYHGFPKLFGHVHISVAAFTREGFPAYFNYISGAIELLGGIALVAGIFTRIAALLIAGETAVALWKAHHMFLHLSAVPTYQLPLALCVAAFALATCGAGALSLDYAFFGAGGRVPARKAKAYG